MSYFGAYIGAVAINGFLDPPTITNLTPAPNSTPGEPDAFAAVFSIARYTPIEFDVVGLPANGTLLITFKFGTRDETYVALAPDLTFRWPFDADSEIGDTTVSPVHVSILPRGGWPPTSVEMIVAAALTATGP